MQGCLLGTIATVQGAMDGALSPYPSLTDDYCTLLGIEKQVSSDGNFPLSPQIP